MRGYNDDLSGLDSLLNEKSIDHKLRRHPASAHGVKELIGYYPAGENQILISLGKNEFSVIRGMASFGAYEVMQINGPNATPWSNDPERFGTAQELVEALEAWWAKRKLTEK